ncbi:EpsG family protein [Sphingobacterium sp. SRCM116780]|uniref:EpsG family protein n=1 Tax=Sphingobacterium sp. SRCM116780 TaxID=2907623 RepID=UPI001F40D132|nr:EpsG family protein [Sphingobacterium sp. SRCM116780]UIR55951.1 EpsG family protein [Sphingobacterium sp. SRCM116780]
MIYFVIFFIALFLFLRYVNSTSKSEGRVPYTLLCIMLVILSALRYRVGGDSLYYFDIFDSYPTLLTLSSYDFINSEYNLGWIVFNATVKSIGNSFYFFQFFHALIVNAIIFYFIQKYAKNKFLTVSFYLFFYFFYFNMEILRESLAIVIFLLAIPHLLEKKWLIYILYCLLAYLFHSSALILFVLPIFARKMEIKYQVILLVMLAAVINFISLDNLLGSVFGSFSFAQRASRNYLNKEMSIMGILIPLLKMFAFFIIYIIAQRKKICLDHPLIIFVSPFIILGLLASFIPGVYRFLNYLAIPMLIYTVDILYSLIRTKNKRSISLVKVLSCFLILVLLQLQYLTRDMSQYTQNKSIFFNRYLPYHSIFNEQIDQTRENIFYNSMGVDR